MNGYKDSTCNLLIYMSKSEFSKDEVRSINGLNMKKLFTFKLRMIGGYGIYYTGY